MNNKFLLFIILFAFVSSCTTVYKTGQTPDDVYYSPAQISSEHNRFDSNEVRRVYEASTINDDRTTVRQRRWRRYHENDYDYGYTPYDSHHPVYIDPKTGQSPKYSVPRKVNTGAYNKTSTNKVKIAKTSSGSPGTGIGNFIREVFSGSTNSANYDNNSGITGGKTVSPNKSSSSSKNSSNNAPVRTFGKN